MTLRENLAANLARLCEEEASVAAVCRATAINQQQFFRYLAGRSLPNQRNLEKLSRYFHVAAEELLKEPEISPDVVDPAAPADGWSHRNVRSALKLLHSETRPSIANGFYYVNFAPPRDRTTIVRAGMVIERDGNLTTFRRFTGLGERRGAWWSQFFGDHHGVVVERAHWLYFLGLNARGNREPTMIVARWLSGSRFMLGGQAIVSGPIGPTATALVISPCKPGTRFATVVRGSHVYSVEDPAIEPLVLDALDEQVKTQAENSRRPDLRVKALPRHRQVP